MLVVKRPIYTRMFDNIDLVLIHSNKELALFWSKLDLHQTCALHLWSKVHMKFIHWRAEYYINWIKIKHTATFSTLQKLQNMFFQKIGLHYWIIIWYDYYSEPLKQILSIEKVSHPKDHICTKLENKATPRKAAVSCIHSKITV